MTKIIAYMADCCNTLVIDEIAVGVSNDEDMFDIMMSYKTISNPAKADIHYCLNCYKEKVLKVADRQVSRRKDEKAYKLRVKELSFSLKSQAVMNWRKKNRQ